MKVEVMHIIYSEHQRHIVTNIVVLCVHMEDSVKKTKFRKFQEFVDFYKIHMIKIIQ